MWKCVRCGARRVAEFDDRCDLCGTPRDRDGEWRRRAEAIAVAAASKPAQPANAVDKSEVKSEQQEVKAVQQEEWVIQGERWHPVTHGTLTIRLRENELYVVISAG